MTAPLRLGILGGGQLGMMIAEAAARLGVLCVAVDRAPDVPAARAADLLIGDYEDQALLEALAARVDRVTYEFENVPLEAAAWLADRLPVHPPVEALRVSQERVAEKEFLAACGMEVAPWRAVATRDELAAGWEGFGRAGVLKTRRFGYDGKGQHVVRSPDDLEAAWERLHGRPLLLEGFVRFERELSLVAARDEAGRVAALPLAENHHRDGILRWSVAPAPRVSPDLQRRAEAHAAAVLERLAYVGVVTLEFFQTPDGRLVANEMAPRVHNSGHWSLEGATPDQFALHAAAVGGWEVAVPRLHSSGAGGAGGWLMVNLIGALPPADLVAGLPEARWHLYGKTPRPGRKLGHVTLPAGHPRAAEVVRALGG